MHTMIEMSRIKDLRKETLEIVDRLMDADKAAMDDGCYDVAEEHLADVHLLMEWMNIGDTLFDKLRDEAYEEIQRLI